jgi:hypothetical protein
MFLLDIIHEQLPRQLRQRLKVIVMPHLSWEPATVIFEVDGRSEELTVDPETGLTELQVAHLCVIF